MKKVQTRKKYLRLQCRSNTLSNLRFSMCMHILVISVETRFIHQNGCRVPSSEIHHSTTCICDVQTMAQKKFSTVRQKIGSKPGHTVEKMKSNTCGNVRDINISCSATKQLIYLKITGLQVITSLVYDLIYNFLAGTKLNLNDCSILRCTSI